MTGPADPVEVAELAQRSSMCWVAVGAEVSRPVWHRWDDGALCVVVGGGEQPLPGLSETAQVTVVLRDRATRQRAATVPARVEVLIPHTPAWTRTVAVLLPARLNLPDPDQAAERWARESTVARLMPVGGSVPLPRGDRR